MQRAGQLDTRRARAYVAMLVILAVLLLLIFTEVLRPGWACEMGGCPDYLMGGNPFLVAAVALGLIVSVVLGVTEAQIDREGFREMLDDERRTMNKLKAWRNAYFGAVLGLFVFVILSDSSPAIDMPFLLGSVMVSGALALFATMVVLDRA